MENSCQQFPEASFLLLLLLPLIPRKPFHSLELVPSRFTPKPFDGGEESFSSSLGTKVEDKLFVPRVKIPCRDVNDFMCAVCDVECTKIYVFGKCSGFGGEETFAEGELRNNKFHVVVAYTRPPCLPVPTSNCSLNKYEAGRNFSSTIYFSLAWAFITRFWFR